VLDLPAGVAEHPLEVVGRDVVGPRVGVMQQQDSHRSAAGIGRAQCAAARCSWLRLRVRAAFLADAERSAALRLAEARPPIRPPFFEDSLVSFLPRPEPDLLPPPDSLFTVAQARRSASSSGTPRFS